MALLDKKPGVACPSCAREILETDKVFLRHGDNYDRAKARLANHGIEFDSVSATGECPGCGAKIKLILKEIKKFGRDWDYVCEYANPTARGQAQGQRTFW